MSDVQLSEKQFLHDLMNPLAIATGLLDLTLEQLRAQPKLEPRQMKQLEQSLRAMERIRSLVQRRRSRTPQVDAPME